MSGPRWADVDPADIDPDTGNPYPNYSSPSLSTTPHEDLEGFLELFDGIPDEPGDECDGHVWVYTGTAYGGDDPSYHGEGRVYCEKCGADGDA